MIRKFFRNLFFKPIQLEWTPEDIKVVEERIAKSIEHPTEETRDLGYLPVTVEGGEVVEWVGIAEWVPITVSNSEIKGSDSGIGTIVLNIPRLERGLGDALLEGDLANLINYVYTKPSPDIQVATLDEEELRKEGDWDEDKLWLFAYSIFPKPQYVY